LYVNGDSSLSIKKLAQHLDQMRLGLVRNSESNEKGQKKATFVVEDMNKSTAEVFSRLQLGKYIPARINFLLSPTKNIVQRLIFSRSYKLRADKLIGAPGNAARP